jgi:putative glycerol-1-phosphate prenyltransferase
MRNKDRIYMIKYVRLSRKTEVIGYSSDPDVLGKFRSSDFKIKQSPATHIFIGGSLVETNIIDELLFA